VSTPTPPGAEVCAPPAAELWERLQSFELFRHFSPQHRDNFLDAYQRNGGTRLRRFAAGELVGRKGEYEVDLCFVLKGAVELFVRAPGNRRFNVATLRAGAFYGELGALGGIPFATDIMAAQDSEILYVPLKFVMPNAEARAILAGRYREHAMRAVIGRLELFSGVAAGLVDQLIERAEILRHEFRGFTVVCEGEADDAFYIVRDGHVNLIRERAGGERQMLAYLRAGDYFGAAALPGGIRYDAGVLTAGKCELIKIRGADLRELCERYPEVGARIRATLEQRAAAERRLTPEVSNLLEQSGQLGVIQAEALLVIKLDLCVNCNNCVTACESLHGESRLSRDGIAIDGYLVPTACRHCNDPKCMSSCPPQAIRRRPDGEIYINYETCIGCGNCEIACPFNSIKMIPTPTFDQAQAEKARMTGDPQFRPYPVVEGAAEPGFLSRLLGLGKSREHEPGAAAGSAAANHGHGSAPDSEQAHVPAKYPIKCDLCDGLPYMGCVHSCPTGAAVRIDPATLFAKVGAVGAGTRVLKARTTL
jgi:cGMP-dependent protein kinase 2